MNHTMNGKLAIVRATLSMVNRLLVILARCLLTSSGGAGKGPTDLRVGSHYLVPGRV